MNSGLFTDVLLCVAMRELSSLYFSSILSFYGLRRIVTGNGYEIPDILLLYGLTGACCPAVYRLNDLLRIPCYFIFVCEVFGHWFVLGLNLFLWFLLLTFKTQQVLVALLICA